MIELTVKTLDSQNHQFTVEDDITVEQFKVKIADTVNIPADTQRIIYCGRVLQDSSKLADYDVNGKVVHLVQRPPPGTTPRSNSRSVSPQPQRRGFRGFRGLEQGNAMYLGSMAFPGNLMESQGIVPPPPTHSLSGSRLNVARRMLRRAEAVIQFLENPAARAQDQTVSEDNAEEEEVTPVIEARVIVPNNSEPIDEVLNAVQNTLMNATNNAGNLNSASNAQSSSDTASVPSSSEATPTGATPRSSSSENLAGESRSTASNGLPENASRAIEMAELLTMLGQLQVRFAPFLERYQTFMRDDPEVAADNQRTTQMMLSRVSEVMHFLGHAYHSLSDLMIRVRTPPPRPLLCRPILIQHSAVVQTGIPIQVEVIEAQINLSADRVPPPTTNTTTVTSEGANTTSTATTAAPQTPTTNTNSANTNARPTISVQPGFVGLPFLPNTAMRVQSFPVDIRTMRPVNQPRPQNNTAETTSPTGGNANDATNNTGSANATSNNQENPQGGAFNFNPNVEFFMEVTPEGITIDSLETTLVGSNQANDLLRGALNGPPPEFLQSLMQMAGQIINRNIATTTASPPASESTQSPSSQPSSTNAGQGAQPASSQNSQARVNTQTNPTTSTYTRSTSRPHVHLAQQAMQGIRGFDPFLPCNSHHISRRRVQSQAIPVPTMPAPPSQPAPNAPPREENTASGDQRNARNNYNILNFINGVVDSIRSDQRRGTENEARSSASASSNSANGDHIVFGLSNMPSLGALFSNLQGNLQLPDLLRRGPTLDQLLQQFQDDPYVPGENIFIDLIMLFVRNLTLVDIFALYSGNIEPINRNISEIQSFSRTRICNGDTSTAGIDRAVETLIMEMQPFLQNFAALPIQNDIDMVRSAEQLFRQRLPNIINIAINLNNNTTRILIDQCLTTVRQLLALTVLASATGQRGVEHVYEQIVTAFMRDIPQDIQNWTLLTSRAQLRQILLNLSIPESILQPYIVHKPIPAASQNQSNQEPMVQNDAEVELMDVDVQEVRTEINSSIIMADTEPLPNVVIGSEPWHGQVPEDWVPIITRDAQKQRRQNPQGPFSDSYLSGMPSKRRKIVNNSKPQGSLPQVLSDSVKQAISASGLTSVAPLETVAQAASTSPEIQNAYKNLFRSTVQSNLKDNEEFFPERYPNVSNYFNSGSQ